MKKPTHLFDDQWQVVVLEDSPGSDTAKIEYVGPNVPGNRKKGDIRMASKRNIFTGQPTLKKIAK